MNREVEIAVSDGDTGERRVPSRATEMFGLALQSGNRCGLDRLGRGKQADGPSSTGQVEQPIASEKSEVVPLRCSRAQLEKFVRGACVLSPIKALRDSVNNPANNSGRVLVKRWREDPCT